jgi:hypothetical protein
VGFTKFDAGIPVARLQTKGQLAIDPHYAQNPSMSEMAFHEKAGQSQVDSFVFSLDKVFLPPSRHCRHPSIRPLR